jgi:uncharacterized membrane-anchored protein YhcB (DUF1043 family)
MNEGIGALLGFAAGVIVTAIILVHQAAENIENYQICQRTIQYQLDKTPEEVQTLFNAEKKREGR